MKPRPRLIPQALLGVLLSVVFFANPSVRALNLITNDNFIADTHPWELHLGWACSATLTNADGWARANITAGGSAKSGVSIEQQLGEPLLNGVIYTIAFDLMADASKTIDVVVLNSSRAIMGGFYNIPATTTPTRRKLTYTHSQADAVGAYLSFRVGGNTTAASIDNVVFARQGVASQLLTRNPDGTWSFPTVNVGGKSWNAGAYDFSYAGYNYGEREELIDIPAATQTISAVNDEDITDKLNAALALLPGGGTVIIPAGTFRIGTGGTDKVVTVDTDNTVIRGAGMGVTTLKVDPTYHPTSQQATFGNGVITFTKPFASNWYYGWTRTTATQSVPLGARSITVADASSISPGDTIVVRQIMWQSFVEQYAYNASKAPKPWRWTNYDANNVPLFTDKGYSFRYYLKVLSKSGPNNNTLNFDVPIPHELNLANGEVTVGPPNYTLLRNCGMQDLTFTAEPEAGVDPAQNSLGSTIVVGGLYNGLFKNIEIASFRSLAFATNHSVNVSFLNCIAANSINGGVGGAGYGFYIRAQNVLYKNCFADRCGLGYTTASPTASNVVIKNCRSLYPRWNPERTSGPQVDDSHLKFSHGILWDNHYSMEVGLIMTNNGTLSTDAYETCGWSVVWNYENEGYNTKTVTATGTYDRRHNFLGTTPAEFGMVIGAHAGSGPDGIRVHDGYTRYPSTYIGVPVAISQNLQVGTVVNRVLYEYTGQPVAESLYDVQFAQRPKLLP